jgi:hypothetical protein
MMRETNSNRLSRYVALPLGLLLAATLLGGCKHNIYPDFDPPIVCSTRAAIDRSVFFIGDAGAPELPDTRTGSAEALVDPVLVALQRDAAKQVAKLGPDRTAVVVLGDNIYPSGLDLPGEPGRAHGIRVLEAQIAAIGEAQGLFTLGNHDWDQGSDGRGWDVANSQVEFMASRAPNISIHPPDTCAGPDVVDFGETLRFVFLDLWAAIYQVDHPDHSGQTHCELKAGDGTIAKRIEEIFADSHDRDVILVTHAPMMTSGPHGGYFPWREHVFPLRVFHRDLWIPLPVIGSIFPLSRILGVTDTDMMSANYRSYIDQAKELFQPGMPTLVAAGHEHSLQVHVDPTGVLHAVSGAGSVEKVDFVRAMNSDLMSLAAPGYMRLDTYEDKKKRLNVFALDDDMQSRFVYSTCVP